MRRPPGARLCARERRAPGEEMLRDTVRVVAHPSPDVVWWEVSVLDACRTPAAANLPLLRYPTRLPIPLRARTLPRARSAEGVRQLCCPRVEGVMSESLDLYRLPRTVIPTRYDLTIEPDLQTARFSGCVFHGFLPLSPEECCHVIHGNVAM
jgi:hypothetical protein